MSYEKHHYDGCNSERERDAGLVVSMCIGAISGGIVVALLVMAFS